MNRKQKLRLEKKFQATCLEGYDLEFRGNLENDSLEEKKYFGINFILSKNFYLKSAFDMESKYIHWRLLTLNKLHEMDAEMYELF